MPRTYNRDARGRFAPTPELSGWLRRRRDEPLAEWRARRFGDRFLTDDQRATVSSWGYLDVKGSAGRRYRIFTSRGVTGNVKKLSADGGIIGSRCAHIYRYAHPVWDTFIAQMFAIETDESKFLDVAEIYGPLY